MVGRLEHQHNLKKSVSAFVVMYALAVLGTIAVANPVYGQTFTVLHTFGGQDGAHPVAGITLDSAGNLYGDTSEGGALNDGVVFQLDQNGNETVLHSFDGSDGEFPTEDVVFDKAGNLYGMAGEGPGGAGVLFKINTSGKYSLIHEFQGGLNNNPGGPTSLLPDGSGNLYGTTLSGGRSFGCCGVLFKLTANDSFSIIHAFNGSDEGDEPASGLTMDANGDVYGTTLYGGNINCKLRPGQGCGVIFKIDKAGQETVLHRFNGDDGAFPGRGALILDAKGNLYGSTGFGGNFTNNCPSIGCGTLFKLQANGHLVVLYKFTGGVDDQFPSGNLARDEQGNLYGATEGGGNTVTSNGTVFMLSPTGKLTVLHTLDGNKDGATPIGGVVRDAAGNLYGTAYQAFGFFNRLGTVFKVTP